MSDLEDLIAPTTKQDDEKEKFDFSSPEHVLIHVICEAPETGPPSWKAFSIEECNVIWGAKEDVTGAASYEMSYGGFLDYTIKDMIDCPGSGYWVVENVTGRYIRGDGWMTDDDMDFYHGDVRPATEDEIKLM